jgi:hypothetical protein
MKLRPEKQMDKKSLGGSESKNNPKWKWRP